MNEFTIQRDFHVWCQKQPYILESWHVPNGMHSSSSACSKMKQIGLKKGVCDYWILLENRGIIAIEFKTNKGCLSPEQTCFIDHLQQCNIPVAVCRSVFEAANFVREQIKNA